jgi:hypothetical protein
MTKKEFIATMKRHESTIAVIEAEIEKVKQQYLKEQLALLNFNEGDIVEVEEMTRRFGDLSGKVRSEWIRGYIRQIQVDDDGTLTCHLGKLKKDGTPSAQGNALYCVHLTGEDKQRIRKVK